MSTRNLIRVEIVIVGGGIAGLWLLNLLRGRGHSAILIERSAFGDGQTIRSQGMIHGGLKYALNGRLTSASETIATMPQRWRSALTGSGGVDLRGVRVLSDRCFLWSTNRSSLGRLGGFLASKALRGRVRHLDRTEFPPPFDAPAFRGTVYELDELVVDTASLLAHLATSQRAHILCGDVTAPQLLFGREGALESIRMQRVEITASRFVFAAGAGNQTLIDALPSGTAPHPDMQRRPLHQLILRRAQLSPLYAHCVEHLAGSQPRLTITSHIDRSGARVWYIGGQLANDGVELNTAAQIGRARTELAACLPWIDLSTARLESVRIDRAEPRQSDGRRPDQAFVATVANVLICWPTKLALAPDLGDKVLAALSALPASAPILYSTPNAASISDAAGLLVANSPWDR